ncbi:hypothetical protein BRC92_09230 [Halobacteriales archaeon QS_4_69_31]|nr:MAG: hypothetical protein BRC92_09230 [Halobacteriales archaeon QS_4_69_31]
MHVVAGEPLGPAQSGPGPLADGPLDPSVVAGVPPLYRAAGSFVLVALFGVAVLSWSQRFVEGSVEASMARPHVSVVYGLVAYGLVGFLGMLFLVQLSFVGLTGSSLAYVVAGLVGVGVLVLAGLGYAVVGSALVELVAERQPWNGLVLGAVLSGLAVLVLPPLAGLLAWVVLAAVGVGGPVREWMHAERTVATESGS